MRRQSGDPLRVESCLQLPCGHADGASLFFSQRGLGSDGFTGGARLDLRFARAAGAGGLAMRYVEATAPSVIDEELCRACIHLLQPKELTPSGTIETEVNRQSTVTKQQNLPFSEVEYLVFSFKSARARVARAIPRSQPSAPLALRAERPRLPAADPACAHAASRPGRALRCVRRQTSSRSTTWWASTGWCGCTWTTT